MRTHGLNSVKWMLYPEIAYKYGLTCTCACTHTERKKRVEIGSQLSGNSQGVYNHKRACPPRFRIGQIVFQAALSDEMMLMYLILQLLPPNYRTYISKRWQSFSKCLLYKCSCPPEKCKFCSSKGFHGSHPSSQGSDLFSGVVKEVELVEVQKLMGTFVLESEIYSWLKHGII